MPLNGSRAFGLNIILFYKDGTTKETMASFNPDTDSLNNWQYTAAYIVAEKPYQTVKIELVYDYNANTVSFDGIGLYREEFGNSYTYDADGNVISVKDLQKQITTYEYTNNNLTKQILPNGAELTYTYDSYHNVKTATSEEGIVYEFVYDTYGNNTSVSIVSADGSKITTSAEYTSDGNRMVSATDALGNVTKYSYNANTNMLEWVQYPNDTDGTNGKDDTRTYYSYDGMYRMVRAFTESNTLDLFCVDYHYGSDGLLSSIETQSTWYDFYYCAFDLRTEVIIGSYTLAAYSYSNDRNYYLETLDYGNGDSISYEYDNMGRVTKQTYEDGETVSYKYDNNGALATVTDSETGIKTTYYYDFIDRMMKYIESGDGYSHSVGYEYDQRNNLTSIVDTINGVERKTTYSYDEDNRIESVIAGDSSTSYTYDGLGRISQEQTKDGENVVLTDSYTFHNPTPTTTSAQVAAHTVASSGFNATYTYTYDDNGNILSVSDGTYTTSYVYDTLNQLVRENNQRANKTWTWLYDEAGNILLKRESSYTTAPFGTNINTIDYTYGDSDWGDLLTSHDDKAITYDGVGNMLSYNNKTYTWKHGRQLTSISDGTTTWNYTYNADGLRTKRTNGTTTYNYVYNGSQLTRMTVGTDTLYFAYDASGVPMSVTYNGAAYYYVTNLQGDVIAILDGNGTQVVSYTYDAWGKHLSTDGTMATTLGTVNPLRYRGYVYDHETGLYYVSSRYYYPEIGRWINADNQIAGVGGEVLGCNMFAYCFNNPVNMDDQTGNWPKWIKSTVKWVAEKVFKPIVQAVQDASSRTSFTYSTGIGTGGSVTGYGAQVQVGISFDSKGNMAIQGTIGAGFSTTAGWSGTVYKSITNAPDISALEGPGYQTGGIYGWNIGYVPVVAGCDVNFIPIPDSERTYLGGTFTTGFGSPGFEGHVDWSFTGTLPYSKINIFESAENVYYAIMEW